MSRDFSIDTNLVSFESLPAYRIVSPSYDQRHLHPSQRNYYRKISPEHRALITYTLVLAFPEVNNSSRDFSIDTNLVSS